MTDLAGLAPKCPRLPSPTTWPIVVSLILHVVLVATLRRTVVRPAIVGFHGAVTTTTYGLVDTRRIVFLADARPGAGGGGGGNGQRAPMRRAQGVGHDRTTLRVAPVATPAVARDPDNALARGAVLEPGLVLEARPLASGTIDRVGIPEGGVSFGTSLGPGSGGGVGDGVGTGIGSGRGPGLGGGTGGGTGGGAYRPGGAVTPPRVLTQTRPTYAPDPLERHVTGSVVLELVVTRDGLPANIRVTRSLEPELDAEAIKAVEQWRFAPGRFNNGPVDVVVSVILDFSIR